MEEGKHPLNFNNVCKIVIEEVISYKITRNPFHLPTYPSIVNKYVWLQICRQRGDIEITTFTHLPPQTTTNRYIIFNRVKEVFCRYLLYYICHRNNNIIFTLLELSYDIHVVRYRRGRRTELRIVHLSNMVTMWISEEDVLSKESLSEFPQFFC